ncbi:capping complex subunit for YIEGIA [Paenibacillus sp. TAB 01]|uniref:capping complex subunit for YIEGIA n=1 Tax=Paenibacillus sp. TAB 01 TaxID=3368988 RepID=UPI0037535341
MGKIMAVVTADKEQVAGGAPIFLVPNAEELQKVAFKLEKILDASAHDLQNGVMILVDHKSSSE